MNVNEVLQKLNGVHQAGQNQWMARCPCRNDDHNPSLSVGMGNDGRILFNCHRGGGCDASAVCDALEITVADLYPEKPKATQQKLQLTNTWDYRDADGKLLFQKLRYVDDMDKKTFRQRRPDGAGGWEYNLNGIPKVLYRLREVVEAVAAGSDVWVVEGEKDADNVTKTGRCATTMPGGAGKWLDEHTDTLVDAKRVVVVADNDEPGTEHAFMVAARLEARGVPVLLLHSPVGKDVTDLLRSGHEITDLEKLARPGELVLPDDPFSTVVAELVDLAQDGSTTVGQKVGRARMLLDRAESDGGQRTGRLVSWDALVAESDDDSYDWLIPQVLEREERVIVVAPEGVGKSMLARQVALCVAAGVHPFTLADIPPARTLYVDLENPERIIRRTSRRIVTAARHRSGIKDEIDAHLFSKPDGLNLLDVRDRVQLEEVIEAVAPDLLCLGPLYKSFIDPGGRTSESIAIEVATYLDSVRATYGCALWLEHHAPLGSSGSRDLRPFGSAVWSRWPEFGLALEQDPTVPGEYTVGAFRGARDERSFPKRMKRGSYMPFEVVDYA